MRSVDLWLVSFGLRCCALVACELFAFLFAIPTLFDLHANLADAGAAVLALAAIAIGFLWGAALNRECALMFRSSDDE